MLTRSKKIIIPANTVWYEELPLGEFLEHITYHSEAEGFMSLESGPSPTTDVKYRIINNGDTFEREVTLWIGRK